MKQLGVGFRADVCAPLVALCALSLLATTPLFGISPGPQLIQYSGALSSVARLPDGRLFSIYTLGRPMEEWELPGPEQPAFIRYSSDHGFTWSEPRVAFSYPPGRGSLPPRDGGDRVNLVVDRKGHIHVFGMRTLHRDPRGNQPRAAAYNELYHNVSRDGGKTWSSPKRVDFGHRYGTQMMAIQLASGRLLTALNYASDYYVRERGEYEWRIVAVHSDNEGENWRVGGDDISVPLGPWIGHPGAIEPALVELRDGRVWMIIRTQTGRFYEAFSKDGGQSWSTPAPTQIRGPNAPADILRLSDGRLLLSWNDISQYPGEVLRHGRQYLHIAVSEDDGKSWSRSKRIAQPREGEHPNTQVRYPELCETADNHVLVVYIRVGSLPDETDSPGVREILRIDPNWIRR